MVDTLKAMGTAAILLFLFAIIYLIMFAVAEVAYVGG